MERADARQRILDAAIARIAEEGIDGVRIARIAMDAGVSAALIHYHFASRDALLGEALEYSYELAGDMRTVDIEALGAVPRLKAMIEQCLPLPGHQREDFILWVELWLRAARAPELRPTAARLYERMHEWFHEAVADGITAGELRADADPDAIADLAVALLDGYGVRALVGDPALDVDKARAAVWDAIATRIDPDA